jgi:hypothetical protein
VTPDYYAILGLSPTSEDVVIRAAYRALIRRYHPDGNASTAAAARARAINAAYEVLIDPEKRAEYDEMRAASARPIARSQRSALPAPSRLFTAALVTLLLLLLFLVIWSPLPLVKPPAHVTHSPTRSPKADPEIPILPPAEEPVAMADVSAAEVANPQLDEPLPLVPSPKPAAPRQAPAPKLATAKPSPPVVTKPAPLAGTPNVNCRSARTRVEITVCGNANLANLDRQQTMLYSQSWVRADPAKQKLLQATRERFIARRDGCRSIACTRAAYLARMREVSEIMIGLPPPN